MSKTDEGAGMLKIRKQRFLFGLFAVLIALSFAVPFSEEICRKNEYTGQKECAPNHPVAVALWSLMKVLDDASVAFTAFATVAIAVFTYTLWLSSKRQLARSREVERAYVTGGGDYLRTGPQQTIHEDANGDRHFLVAVGNYGKTPAFVLGYDIRFARLSDLLLETVARPVQMRFPHIDRLAPGGHTKAIQPHRIDKNTDVAYGAFWYEDIWHEKIYEFRFILSLDADRTRTNVVGVHEDYNRTE